MTTLSLAMIVKNEEANLPRCLASVQGLVDEIIVVDTGSTDRTVAIAESFGAKLSTFTWADDFSAARNESLRRCTGDWILVLDADEAIDSQDHARIRAALQQPSAAAFNLTLRSYVLDGTQVCMDVLPTPNDGAYTLGSEFSHHADVPGLRLCRRVPGLAFEGRIHELLTPFFLTRSLPIGSLDAVIHHFGKVDADREAEKKVAYLHLAQAQAQADPRSPQAWFNLMSQAALAAEWPQVVQAAETYMRLERQVPLPVLTTLALAHQEMGTPRKGVPLLQKVLSAEPRHRLALVLLPQLLLQAGLLPEAIKAFRRALPIHPDVADLHLGLAKALSESGKSAEAVEALRTALGHFPKLAPLWERLIQLRLAEGQQAQATAEAWEALRALPEGGGGHWHALVAGFLMQAGQIPQARAILDLGLKLHPSHEGLQRLRGLDPEAR